MICVKDWWVDVVDYFVLEVYLDSFVFKIIKDQVMVVMVLKLEEIDLVCILDV